MIDSVVCSTWPCIILMPTTALAKDHGRVHDWRMAARPGLDVDSGDGGMRRRDVRNLAPLGP